MKTKFVITFLWAFGFFFSANAQVNQNNKNQKMDRTEMTEKNLKMLFGDDFTIGGGNDPEMMTLLQKYIFGEVFTVGDLDVKTRELITVVNLTALQQMPQLKGHMIATLKVGVTPVELREAIYQTASIIGFPRTLNALNVLNEVFKEKGIKLPLENQATVTDATRYEKGSAIQKPLYGDNMEKAMQDVSGGMGKDVARFLAEVHFGDFYTRKGLDLKTRELLTYCVLTTIGADAQLKAHIPANIKAGNSLETLSAGVIQSMPYIGFPPALKALNIIKTYTNENKNEAK